MYNDSNKKNTEDYNPAEALELADLFWSVADELQNRYDKAVILDWGQNGLSSKDNLMKQEKRLIIPSTVNRALACELYLKALCASQSGSWKKGHRLLDLYESLPKQIQEEIYNAFEKSITPCLFKCKLKSISDAFLEVRYLHEYNKVSMELKFFESFSIYVKKIAHAHV